MSKALVTFALCSMIALFVVIYIAVEYMTDESDFSASEIPTKSAETSSVPQAPSPTPANTPTMPAATATSPAGLSQSQIAPTASPASLPATVTVEPTFMPAAESTPSALVVTTPTPGLLVPTVSPAADLAEQLVQRVVNVEEQVKSGHIDATVESDQGINSSSSITFDLGSVAYPARLHFVSSYASSEDQRTTELIIIGDTYWERINGGQWVVVGAREGVWGQVQSYLPRVAPIADTGQIRVEDNTLTWSDPARDIDATLQVDEASGVPQQLRRVSRSTGTTVIVTYRDWNAPVDIQMPSGS